jgi:hypothetical protein
MTRKAFADLKLRTLFFSSGLSTAVTAFSSLSFFMVSAFAYLF